MIQEEGEWVACIKGVSKGNPGASGCGVYVYSPTGKAHILNKFLGRQTANYADYSGLILAFQKLSEFGVKKVLVRADSELLIKQMKGEYKVKSDSLKNLFNFAKKMAANFESVRFEQISKDRNSQASM